jgi:MFS family permease
VWATHFIIDVGFPVAWFVPLVILWIFGMDHLRAVWRGALLLGAIPPLLLTFFRLFMDEPEAYQKNAMKHVKIPYGLILKRYWPKLLAVSFCWFLYDWITYPFGMYAGDITSAATGPNPTLYQTLGWGCLVNFFYVPGAFVGAWMSDWLGPKYCMVFGSVMQAAFGFGLSGGYEYFKQRVVGFAIVYGICE